MHLSNPGSHFALESHNLYDLNATITAAWKMKYCMTHPKSREGWNKSSFKKKDIYKTGNVQFYPSTNGINQQYELVVAFML